MWAAPEQMMTSGLRTVDSQDSVSTAEPQKGVPISYGAMHLLKPIADGILRLARGPLCYRFP